MAGGGDRGGLSGYARAMTDAALPPAWTAAAPRPAPEEIALPAPVPFDAPVLIGDCATPLAGETVLSLLWKWLARDG